jgi:hypothetical protein
MAAQLDWAEGLDWRGMRFGVLVLAAALGVAAASSETTVGWRFQVALDPSRTYEPEPGDLAGAGPRPVAITLFYPVSAAGPAATTYAVLARLGAYDRFREPPESALAEAAAATARDLPAAALSRPTASARDARPAAGRYPLVLFAHTSPLGMAAMSEDLVSGGFVVAGVISRGADRGAYRLSVADVQAMGDDLRFARDVLGRLPFVDATRAAVIGMSNGALGAVALANQSPVRAIVSLDGTVGEKAAARVLPQLGGAATPESVPPLLHLYAPDNAYLDFSELYQRPGACTTVRVPAVAHSDFLTFARLRPPDAAPTSRRERVAEKFSVITRLTREFLEGPLWSRSPAALQLTDSDKALGLTSAACRDHRPPGPPAS